MAKVKTTIWVDPKAMKKLKLLGVEHDRPIGDVIAGLARFAEMYTYISDENVRELFKGMLATALANSRIESGWVGEETKTVAYGASGDDLDETREG